MSDETQIFDNRREFLLAASTSSLPRFHATREGAILFGLAKSEHRFLLAVAQHEFEVGKVLKADFETMLMEEIKK